MESQLATELSNKAIHEWWLLAFVFLVLSGVWLYRITRPEPIRSFDWMLTLLLLAQASVLLLLWLVLPSEELNAVTLGSSVLLMLYVLPLLWRIKRDNQKILFENKLSGITLNSVGDAVITTDTQQRVVMLNAVAEFLTGWKHDEALGHAIEDLFLIINADTREKADCPVARSMAQSEVVKLDFNTVLFSKDGRKFYIESSASPIRDDAGNIFGSILVFRNVTERRKVEDEIKQLAFYDALTQLPNRRLLLDRIKLAVLSSVRTRKYCAILFIDLDKFKQINDTLGHEGGDVLLKAVAKRLTDGVRQCDTVARFGGDEFVVLLQDLSEISVKATEQTEHIAEKLLWSLNLPYLINDRQHHCSASVGVTLFKETAGVTINDLLTQADAAMYQSKLAGRGTMRFYDATVQHAANAFSEIHAGLKRALGERQLHLYYQLQVNDLGHPIGAEALLRWIHPEKGIISPADFIPIAEDTKLILPIGQWVLETACAQLKQWEAQESTHHLKLSVNVSSLQLHDPNFLNMVKRIVVNANINPSKLWLEITESGLLKNVEEIIGTILELKVMGVNFSLDDFGTGYSSLRYLKQLPIHQLKIDKSFVDDIVNDRNSRMIVRTIIAMAKTLQLTIVAEGIEDQEQLRVLFDEGCYIYQGYLFGKPVPIEEFESQVNGTHLGGRVLSAKEIFQ